MNRNVGTIDQLTRIVLGLFVIILGLVFGSWWGLVGLVPLLTGLVGRCPAYALFGTSTCTPPPGHGSEKTAGT